MSSSETKLPEERKPFSARSYGSIDNQPVADISLRQSRSGRHQRWRRIVEIKDRSGTVKSRPASTASSFCGYEGGGGGFERHLIQARSEHVLDEVERFSRRTISLCLSQENDDDADDDSATTRMNEDYKGSDIFSNCDQGSVGEHAISNFETIIHIMKGNVGIGVLTLPMAIRNAGLVGGVIGLVVIASICIYCMTLLVRAAHKALKYRRGVKFLDYANTAEASFLDAGNPWSKWALTFRKLVNVFLCATQITSNAVYILFVAQNIKPLIAHYGGQTLQDLNYRYYILMILPFQLAICMVRNLRYLSPFSVLANAIQAVGVGIIFYYIFGSQMKSSQSLTWFASMDRLPLFFGTAIFAIEGISVVLPIENQMRNPKDMLGINGVLNMSMTLVLALYIAMGFYGYLKYGEDIEATISLNLPQEEVAAQATLALFSLAIFFSYALQFYVLMEILGPNVLRPLVAERWYNVAEYSTRILINLFTFGLAATIPWLDLFVALVGAVKMSTLSIMAPALIDTASNWEDLGRFKWIGIKNSILFAFGFFGCVDGTVVSLQNILEKFMNPDDQP